MSDSEAGAIFSDCGQYRYLLWRRWTSHGPDVIPDIVWIMLNPSTADERTNDATIRRVMAFSRAWGYGGCRVINLYALRATDPKELRLAADPVGPDNELRWEREMLSETDNCICVCAWGANPMAKKIEAVRMDWLRCRGIKVYCVTKDVAKPNHPLYLPNGLPMISMDCYEPNKRAR